MSDETAAIAVDPRAAVADLLDTLATLGQARHVGADAFAA